MSYLCDICSTSLPDKSYGKFFDQQRVLTSPGYWETLISRESDAFNDAALGITLQTFCNDNSGFTVCQSCVLLLDRDVEKAKRYHLERFVSSNPSGAVDLTSCVVVAATVWEKIRGNWPTSIDHGFKKFIIGG